MIILLMGAGAGSRFVKDGHLIPKPLIPVRGSQPMYSYVGEQIGLGWKGTDDTVHFVTQSSFRRHVEAVQDEEHSRYIETLYVPDMVKAGPAWSAIAVTLGVFSTVDVLLLDSDCFVLMNDSDKSQIDAILAHRVMKDSDAVVYTVKAQEDRNDVASVTGGHVQIHEGGVKKGDQLNVGAYWFRTVGDFRRAVFDTQQELEEVRELKISDVINMRMNAEYHELDGTFVNLGSPELLEAYREEKGYGSSKPTI